MGGLVSRSLPVVFLRRLSIRGSCSGFLDCIARFPDLFLRPLLTLALLVVSYLVDLPSWLSIAWTNSPGLLPLVHLIGSLALAGLHLLLLTARTLSCSSAPQGNVDQAQAHFRRALQSNPEHARSKLHLKVRCLSSVTMFSVRNNAVRNLLLQCSVPSVIESRCHLRCCLVMGACHWYETILLL